MTAKPTRRMTIEELIGVCARGRVAEPCERLCAVGGEPPRSIACARAGGQVEEEAQIVQGEQA